MRHPRWRIQCKNLVLEDFTKWNGNSMCTGGMRYSRQVFDRAGVAMQKFAERATRSLAKAVKRARDYYLCVEMWV